MAELNELDISFDDLDEIDRKIKEYKGNTQEGIRKKVDSIVESANLDGPEPTTYLESIKKGYATYVPTPVPEEPADFWGELGSHAIDAAQSTMGLGGLTTDLRNPGQSMENLKAFGSGLTMNRGLQTGETVIPGVGIAVPALDLAEPHQADSFQEMASNTVGIFASALLFNKLGGRLGKRAGKFVPGNKAKKVTEATTRILTEAGGVSALSPEGESVIPGVSEFGFDMGVVTTIELLQSKYGKNALGAIGDMVKIMRKAKNVDEVINPIDEAKPSMLAEEIEKFFNDPIKRTKPEVQAKVDKLKDTSLKLEQYMQGKEAELVVKTEKFKPTKKVQAAGRAYIKDTVNKVVDKIKKETVGKTKAETRAILEETANLLRLGADETIDVLKEKTRLIDGDRLVEMFNAATQPLRKGSEFTSASDYTMDAALRLDIENVVDDIIFAETAVGVGVDPKAGFKAVDDAVQELTKIFDEGAEALYDDDLLDINETLKTDLKAILDDPEIDFNSELPIFSGMSELGEMLSKAGADKEIVDDATKLRALIKQATDETADVPAEVHREMIKTLGVLGGKEEEALTGLLHTAAHGLSDIKNVSQDAKSAITKLMLDYLNTRSDDLIQDLPIRNFKQELGDINKQLEIADKAGDYPTVQQLQAQKSSLKSQFNQMALSDQQIGTFVFGQTANANVANMYMLMRAVHGDPGALKRLNWNQRAVDEALNISAQATAMNKELVDEFGDEAASEILESMTDHNFWTTFWRTPEKMLRKFKLKSMDNALDELRESEIAMNRWAREEMPEMMRPIKQSFNKLSKANRTAATQTITRMSDFADEALEKAQPRVDSAVKRAMSEFYKKVDAKDMDKWKKANKEKIASVRAAAKADVYKKINGEVEAGIEEKLKGLPQEVQDHYRLFRNAYDDILKEVNTKIDEYNLAIDDGLIKAEKMPHINRRVGYYTHSDLGGHYDVMVEVDAGKFIKLSRGVDEAQGVIDIKTYIADNPQFKGKIRLMPKIIATSEMDSQIAGGWYNEVEELYGKNADDLRELIGKNKFKKDTVGDVFFAHKMPRKGKMTDYQKDTVKVLESYMYAAGKFSSYMKASRMMKEAANQLENITGKNSKPFLESASYARSLADYTIGRKVLGEETFDKVAQHLMELPVFGRMMNMLGFKPGGRHAQKMSSMLLTYGRLMTIGFNVSTALINTSILATNVAPLLGGARVALSMGKWATAAKEGSVYYKLARDAGVKLNLGGATLTNAVEDVADKGILNTVGNLSMYAFNKTEDMARVTTLIAAYDEVPSIIKRVSKLEGQGKTLSKKGDRLLREIADRYDKDISSEFVREKFAKEMMLLTNFDFSRMGLAPIFRNPAAAPFLQFKSFIAKQAEFMIDGYKGEFSSSENMKILMGFFALGGMLSLPGVNILDLAMRATMGTSPKQAILDHTQDITGGDFIAGGLPRVAGFDISQRLVLDDPGFLLDTSNILGIFPARLYEGTKLAMQGQFGKASKLGLTPSVGASAMKAYQAWTGGPVRSRISDKVSIAEKDMKNPYVWGLAMGAGFSPNMVTDNRIYQTWAKSHNKRLQVLRESSLNSAAKAMRRGDREEAFKALSERGLSWNDLTQYMNRLDKDRKDSVSATLPRKSKMQGSKEANKPLF